MFINKEKIKTFKNRYPCVFTIIAVNIAVYVITLLPGIGSILFYVGMSVNELISNGEIWRIFTSTLIHTNFFHLLFNMLALFLFGPELEKMVGKFRFLTIYLIGGIVGNLATFLIEVSNYVTVGASGSVFGIFGAYLAILASRHRYTTELKKVILPIIVISVILTFSLPNVNAAGHIGGLIGGLIVGVIYFRKKTTSSFQ